jgi:uncharacterized protein YdhG (YjbR/CyaY superfamily)
MTEVEDYISGFSAPVRTLLNEMRRTIRKAAPKASEAISYDMPAFVINGKKLVWFAGFKAHIGFYPGAAAIAAFKKELAAYKTAKGSVQFPLSEPLPVELVSRIVKFKLNGAAK